MKLKKPVTIEDAIVVAKLLGAKRIRINEFRMGLDEELEHSDVTGGDAILTGKIVLAHLRERSDYYSVLERAMSR